MMKKEEVEEEEEKKKTEEEEEQKKEEEEEEERQALVVSMQGIIFTNTIDKEINTACLKVEGIPDPKNKQNKKNCWQTGDINLPSRCHIYYAKST